MDLQLPDEARAEVWGVDVGLEVSAPESSPALQFRAKLFSLRGSMHSGSKEAAGFKTTFALSLWRGRGNEEATNNDSASKNMGPGRRV